MTLGCALQAELLAHSLELSCPVVHAQRSSNKSQDRSRRTHKPPRSLTGCRLSRFGPHRLLRRHWRPAQKHLRTEWAKLGESTKVRVQAPSRSSTNTRKQKSQSGGLRRLRLRAIRLRTSGLSSKRALRLSRDKWVVTSSTPAGPLSETPRS